MEDSERDASSSGCSDTDSETDRDSAQSWQETVELPAPPQTTQCLARPRERADTSWAQLCFQDRDLQGVDWAAYARTRQQIRATRLQSYENYLNRPEVFHTQWPAMAATANAVDTDAEFFRFHRFQSNRSLSVLHFQLRNLLWATNAFDHYFLADNRVCVYNTLSQDVTQVLDLRSARTAADQPAGSAALGTVLISTLCAQHGLLAVGGFHGELVLSTLDGHVLGSKVVTATDSGISNGLELFHSPAGLQIVASNNDCRVRLLQADCLAVAREFELPWPANWTSPSPEGGRLLAAMGDDPVGLLLDARTGGTAAKLRGHLDFSFAAAWHPGGTYLATGNQDTSVRVWDVRRPDASLHLLAGAMCAVRSLRYSPCGRFLAAAEAADFVHLHDHASGYSRAQRIEFFSEIAGACFTPDGAGFTIGLQEARHGGFLQLQRPPQAAWR